MGARRSRGAGPDDMTPGDQTDMPTDETAPAADEQPMVPLIFRGAVVPIGALPPPAGQQQIDQTGPSGKSYHFIQDEPTDVLPEDVPYFLRHPTLLFETAPPDESTPTPRDASGPAPRDAPGPASPSR